MKRFTVLFLIVLLVLAVQAEVKNVIFMIGDGMGVSHVTLARAIKGERLALDDFPYAGLQYTDSTDHNITDSAAAGSALATGYKTKNGMISMTPDYKARKTTLELFKEKGKKTGVVSTTRLTHATPACFSSHIKARYMEYEIGEQQVNSGIEVFLGGGTKKYNDDTLALAEKNGYDIVKDRNSLVKTSSDKVLGLFSESHMSYELDRGLDEPSIALMTRKAIDLLENDNGFFLMVEGGRIDHASHSNDAVGSIYDTLAFDKAVKEVLDYAKRRDDTLVVVTADHSTGGLTLARKKYKYYPEVLKGFSRTPDYIISQLNEDFSNVREVLAQYTDFEWSEEDIQKILKQKDCKRPTRYSLGGLATSTFVRLINDRAMISWSTNAHEGSMVPIFSYGPEAQRFSGMMDNTEIPRRIAESTDLNLIQK
ncbi:MAG: alkaline phosphatase [Candidatus Muiribacteriaceae bacterium]